MKPNSSSRRIKNKVLIVDDHPLLRDGLSRVLNQQSDLMVCGEAGDSRAAMAALAATRPDVVIVDLTMENGNGLDLIKNIHTLHPHLPVLVLSMHHEHLYAERAIRAGARGYVMKREPVGTVIAALRKILSGHVALSEDMVSRLLSAHALGQEAALRSAANVLSDRELDVFRMLGQGLGTRQIAANLNVAASTIESHRAAIKRKLGLAAATELVARAAQFVADEHSS